MPPPGRLRRLHDATCPSRDHPPPPPTRRDALGHGGVHAPASSTLRVPPECLGVPWRPGGCRRRGGSRGHPGRCTGCRAARPAGRPGASHPDRRCPRDLGGSRDLARRALAAGEHPAAAAARGRAVHIAAGGARQHGRPGPGRVVVVVGHPARGAPALRHPVPARARDGRGAARRDRDHRQPLDLSDRCCRARAGAVPARPAHLVDVARAGPNRIRRRGLPGCPRAACPPDRAGDAVRFRGDGAPAPGARRPSGGRAARSPSRRSRRGATLARIPWRRPLHLTGSRHPAEAPVGEGGGRACQAGLG